MSKRPWMKWYPADWRADPRLRMCSLAARGLWIELIGYMHEGQPYGHLTINDRVPTPKNIAALVGAPMDQVQKALDELLEQGVYSIDETGRMVSRRMVRDKAKEQIDAQNGRGGGNPALKGTDNPGGGGGGLTPPVNPPVNQVVKTPDKAHMPEARKEEKEPRNLNSGNLSPLGAPQASPKHKTGARLPADWPLTDDLAAIAYVVRNDAGLPLIDVATEHAKFCDFWHAKAGAGATKLDWVATWRNWCRNARGGNGHTGPEAFGASMRKSIADVVSMFDTEPKAIGGTPCLKLIQK